MQEPVAPRGGDEPGAAPIAVAYAGYFGALGVYAPFMAVYLAHRGFTPRQVAWTLAALPVARVIATPAWTLLADRLQSAAVVLRVVSVGALAALATLEAPLPLTLVLAALLAFTVFRSPASSLLDVLALAWASRTAGDFGRLRAWGTVAYTACTFGAGALIDRAGPATVVHASVAALAATAAATFALPRGVAPKRVRLLASLGVLLRRRRFVALLVTAALHQVGLASYDALFPAYLAGLSSATYAGAAVAVGAASEVLYMTRARDVVKRLGLDRTLALAYAASAARWALMAVVRAPALLVAIQVLHALTFGAFYLAAVARVDEDAPAEVRASAQGVFGAVAWGLASAGALGIAGALQARGGMPAVFVAGALASALAAAITAWLARATPGPTRPGAAGPPAR